MLIFDYIINYFKYGVVGNSLRIDASSACQLRCPSCHQVKEWGATFRRKHLKFADFKKFVDQHPTFKNIELSDNGEIFLNPELEEIIQYAYTKNIALTVRNGVNLNHASQMVLEYLVKCNLSLFWSLLMEQLTETYKIYRQGGDFKRS